MLMQSGVPQSRPAYSLIRFSTPQQALGDSLRRQLDGSAVYCAINALELVESIRDEGLSGYHGVHRKRGALGRFVARFLGGEIPPGVFIAEAFDRITREPPRIAQQLFLSLINGGMDVVTLIDGQYYSAASIDRNIGQLFMSIGLMLGAHMESKNKGVRIGEVWNAPNGRRNGGIGKKTGMPSNIFPAWIVKTVTGPQLDPDKAAILHRIRKLIDTMGVEAIAKLFNDEHVPTLNTRKRARDTAIWDKTTIQKLVRGRQVLGEQAIGRYQDVKDATTGESVFKRVLTGEVKANAYPAVWTEAEWLAANHALDARKRGVQASRNKATYPNLFGEIARCAICQGVMKIRGRGRHGHVYLGCSNAGLHGCTHTQYHRVDQIEADVFAMIGAIPWAPPTNTDEIDSLTARLTVAQREADRLQRSLDAMASQFADAPASIKTAMLKLATAHAEQQASVTTIERRLAALKASEPVRLEEVQTITRRLPRLSGAPLVAARGKLAAMLPALFRHLMFAPQTVTVTLLDGRTYGLGDWTAKGGALVHAADNRRWEAPVRRDHDPVVDGQRGKRALRKCP